MAPYKVLLLACGSYNPPTNMHLRMFEIARDSLHSLGQCRVVGGAISPTHDAYGKNELISSKHRCEMLRLALHSSDWIRMSEWEMNQECWSPTLNVLQHHQNQLNAVMCDNNNSDRSPDVNCLQYSGWIPKEVFALEEPVKIMLLCGADLLESFATPGLWADNDIESIVSEHGLVVITRDGCNPYKFIYESDTLSRLQRHIFIVPEWITNNISSTKVRRALRRQESVRYLIDDAVIEYIAKHGLYGSDKNRFKYQDSIKNLLNIPLNTVMLTPSPSDVHMLSASPSNEHINLNLQPLAQIDQPDSCNKSEYRVKTKNDTEIIQCPGRVVKVLPVDSPTGKNKKVGFVDEAENPKKLLTCLKQTPEVQKVVLERSATVDFHHSPKKPKKPPRLSDPSRSRIVFKRSNSDVPNSQSNSDLETATSVKIEFTKDGIKVISDKEAIV